MLFPALGMAMSIWLLLAPVLGIEHGVRADLVIAGGVVALILAPLSLWSRRAAMSLTALGLVLGVVNFGGSASIGALANLATCAAAFTIAGLAPQPYVVSGGAAPAIAPERNPVEEVRSAGRLSPQVAA